MKPGPKHSEDGVLTSGKAERSMEKSFLTVLGFFLESGLNLERNYSTSNSAIQSHRGWIKVNTSLQQCERTKKKKNIGFNNSLCLLASIDYLLTRAEKKPDDKLFMSYKNSAV